MVSNIRELLSANGLSRIAAAVERLALPSVRLTATIVDETQLSLGASKIGGLPDLPMGQAWPEVKTILSGWESGVLDTAFSGRQVYFPFGFIAQFNLAEIAPYDTEQVLPQSGMLYFFLDYAHIFDAEQPDPYRWKVMYYEGDLSALQRMSPPPTLPKDERYRARALAFSRELCLPYYFPYEPDTIERLGLTEGEELTEDEYHAYWKLQEQLAGNNSQHNLPIHRLLGHAEPIQGDVQLESHLDHLRANGVPVDDPDAEAIKAAAADWRLLLQIDTDDDDDSLIWGDCGRIYYWIQQQALQWREFDKVWLILQCS